jgi:hypothetical protein
MRLRAASFVRITLACATVALLGIAGPARDTAAQTGPMLDHYRMYQALGPAPMAMPDISDQFLELQAVPLDVVQVFGVPTAKFHNDTFTPIVNPVAHLTCYGMPPVAHNARVLVDNQFGLDQPLEVGVPMAFCVPSYKDMMPGDPLNLDHYLCYTVTGPAPDPIPVVELEDQFQFVMGVEVQDPFVLCNPAQKWTEPVVNPIEHLVCYHTTTSPPPTLPYHFITNQFGETEVEVGPTDALCVPSFKRVVTTTTTTTTTSTTSSTSMLSGSTTTLPTAGLCPAVPRSGCATGAARKSRLIMRSSGGPRDLLKWKHGKGAPAMLSAFLAPDTNAATQMELCLYDASAVVQPVMVAAVKTAANCGTRPCWKAIGTRGLRYLDRAAAPDGITKVKLLPSTLANTKVLVGGKGANLPMPALPLAFPLVVQLVVDDGATTNCWQTTFVVSARNDPTMIKTVGP